MKSYRPNEESINQLGYKVLKNNCNKAIDIFMDNTKLHPSSANAWDSLGEAYFECENYSSAAKSFSKAVELAKPLNGNRLKSFQDNLQKARKAL